MNTTKFVRFDNSKQKDFVNELNRRVNQYFSDNNISKFANFNMVVKTIFMFLLYFSPFILILTQVFSSNWMFFILEILMGFGLAGIGLSIMHDANHGAYSKNKTINKILGYCLNMIGGNALGWRIQHNVLHHTFTNVVGLDEDIEGVSFLLRFTKEQKRSRLHRFQFLYAWFLYGLMTIEWVLVKDFKDIKRYNDRKLLVAQQTSFGKELGILILSKVIYFTILIGLPLLLTDYSFWKILLGFLTMHYVGGLILSLIFQSAHVQVGAEFKNNENPKIEENFYVHQLSTTVNFSKKSRVFSWYIGGLNYQIEHHLFPNICHVHYRKISDIVKNTASEYSVPYHEIKTFAEAVFLHHKMLYNLGKA